MGRHRLDLSGPRYEQLAGCCECSNKSSGSIKWEFFDWLRTCYFLRKALLPELGSFWCCLAGCCLKGNTECLRMLLQHTDCKYTEYAQCWNHIVHPWHVFCLYRSVFSVVTTTTTTDHMGTVVAQWLRCCATNRKVTGSIPDGVIGIFHWHNPSDRAMTLGSTQPLTEMSTRRISWG